MVKPLQAETEPKTETESAEGWTATAGGAAVEFQGSKAVAFLTVFSGFGKRSAFWAFSTTRPICLN